MKRLLITTAVFALAAATASDAYAWPRLFRRPARVYVRPAPTAPAPAQPQYGYRTYSYQPAPAGTYRAPGRAAAPGFRAAGDKILGRY